MNKSKFDKVFKIFLIVLGSFACAFANIVFFKPVSMNAGGLNGIGIIISYFFPENLKDAVYDISVAILSVVLWIVGLVFIGKKFALKTLVSTIAFPLATYLFDSVPGVKDFCSNITNILLGSSGNTLDVGVCILFSLIGGTLTGFGVGITLVAGGSTGGVDVLILLGEKLLNIKESISSFLCDGIVILSGILVLCLNDAETYLLPCLVGIISVAITAIMIDLTYVSFNIVFTCDIISLQWEKVSRYAQDQLGKGATIIPIKGGYKLEDKFMVRVVLTKEQYHMLKNYIAEIDPNAFIMVQKTRVVFGEGFKLNRKPTINNGKK